MAFIAGLLFEHDFRSAFRKKTIRVLWFVRQWDHSAHGLPDGVKRVDFDELVLRHVFPNTFVTLAEIGDVSQQSALCLVAYLLWHLASGFRRLDKKQKIKNILKTSPCTPNSKFLQSSCENWNQSNSSSHFLQCISIYIGTNPWCDISVPKNTT